MARRLLAPDGAVTQTDVRSPSGLTRRYTARDGGIYTVSDSDAKALIAEGYTDASLTGASTRSQGRRCTSCGFGSWFATCSRCGGTCEKERP